MKREYLWPVRLPLNLASKYLLSAARENVSNAEFARRLMWMGWEVYRDDLIQQELEKKEKKNES